MLITWMNCKTIVSEGSRAKKECILYNNIYVKFRKWKPTYSKQVPEVGWGERVGRELLQRNRRGLFG